MARMARRILPGTTIRLAHVEPGVSLKVNLRRHVMFWSQGLARFEPSTVRAIRAAIREGDAVLDVGANIGFFSTLLSRWVGDGGRVLAVEPEVENRGLLRANLDSNGCGNVTICECAIGAAPGIAEFSIDAATGATGRLGTELTASELAVGTGKVQVVETRVETLDSLCEVYQVTPSFIKIDIEGDEIKALEGATRILRTARPVIVSELSGLGGAEVIQLLSREKYRMWDLESSQIVGPEDRPFMIVAIPEEQEQGERARNIKEAIGAESTSPASFLQG
ncbi:methyltransferase, FkbM family [Singulisphaera sp. GP187]|nr:FkbM family methyltransferase [Singulisphaera sp. GP187]SIN91899.1 methyltransferase, FkbM family [Singulisphaera sp. GP187]